MFKSNWQPLLSICVVCINDIAIDVYWCTAKAIDLFAFSILIHLWHEEYASFKCSVLNNLLQISKHLYQYGILRILSFMGQLKTKGGGIEIIRRHCSHKLYTDATLTLNVCWGGGGGTRGGGGGLSITGVVSTGGGGGGLRETPLAFPIATNPRLNCSKNKEK